MRLNGLGAGTSVFSARYVGLRHDPRNRRPRQPHVHDSPLVILDVVTTCGCTVPDFSKKPILPGEKTQITVTYDPANRPGSFTKELWVYSSEKRKIATLTVQGSVIPRQKTVEELYPVDAGGGLRLASTLNAFSYIYPGRQVQAAIGYANTSKRPVRLELRPETTSGALRTNYPKQIAPGERGEINFTYLIPADKPRYGTVRDALEVLIDGRSNGTTLVTHGIGVDPQPADATQNAPKADFSENILKFGPVKHAGPVRKKHFTLSNAGGAELIVRAVEGEGHVATTLAPGQKIAPGDSQRCEILLDPRTQDYGIVTEHLVVVTNDPVRPMRRIRVTAIIEE